MLLTLTKMNTKMEKRFWLNTTMIVVMGLLVLMIVQLS